MVSFALSELDMQQILKTLTTLSYVRRKATNILLLYNTHIGVFKMITKGNVTIGLDTRFGPDWPGVRCGARTKAGGKCQRPAVKLTHKRI